MNEQVLIDTSAWIEFSRHAPGRSAVGDEVRALIESDRAVVTQIILVELARGARNEEELDSWADIFSALNAVSLDESAWWEAARNSFMLGRGGVNAPVVDTVIATAAISHGISLLHRDRHFIGIARVLPLEQYSFTQ